MNHLLTDILSSTKKENVIIKSLEEIKLVKHLKLLRYIIYYILYYALYLNLPNAKMYTGNCFRRTGELLSNSGANVTMHKQLGGWKSTNIAQGYLFIYLFLISFWIMPNIYK